MPMQFVKTALAAAALAFNSLAFAADAAPVEAARLLDALQMERVMQQSIEASLNVQIQQNPRLAPYREVMLGFFARHMSYATVKDDLVGIYAGSFTGEELVTLREFYLTPVGRKAIELMPSLLAQGMQMGQQRVKAHLGELEALIQAEAERLKAQQLQQQQQQQPKKKP